MRYFLYEDWLGRVWLVPVSRRDELTHWVGWGSIQHPPSWMQRARLDTLTFVDPQQ